MVALEPEVVVAFGSQADSGRSYCCLCPALDEAARSEDHATPPYESATIQAPAAIASEMKNPVPLRAVGRHREEARPQTSNVITVSIAASSVAARRGSTPSRSATHATRLPAPVRYAQPSFQGSQAGTNAAVCSL